MNEIKMTHKIFNKQLLGFTIEWSSFFSSGFFFSRNTFLAIMFLLIGFFMAYIVGQMIKEDALKGGKNETN